MHAEPVGAPIASSRSATSILSLCGSSSPSSASSKPRVVLQRRFQQVCAIIEGDSALDAKLVSKEFITSQSVDNLFDKVVYRVSLKIRKRRPE
ncbi:hypothetical protein AAWM_08691 [Aspergillus awamori]|uniref:Uncharacterized protein n=1 Tax=Aspergillus awamori TaxID=105351 RepID=A0A401L2T6_ASPAW|nr:hypothetical protein AAWM_08691 [Aspergillus awamori]